MQQILHCTVIIIIIITSRSGAMRRKCSTCVDLVEDCRKAITHPSTG